MEPVSTPMGANRPLIHRLRVSRADAVVAAAVLPQTRLVHRPGAASVDRPVPGMQSMLVIGNLQTPLVTHLELIVVKVNEECFSVGVVLQTPVGDSERSFTTRRHCTSLSGSSKSYAHNSFHGDCPKQ